MDSRPRTPDAEQTETDVERRPVSAHETRPGRIVFTEDDNSDGWIATDLTVDPEP